MLRWLFFHLLVFIYFSLLMAAHARAEILDDGSCVLSQRSSAQWQINSRFDGTQVTLNGPQFARRLSAELNRDFGKGLSNPVSQRAPYEVFLECASGAVTVVANVLPTSESPALCVRSDGALERFEIFSNNQAQPGHACSGERPAHLIAAPLRLDEMQAVTAYLNASQPPGLIRKTTVDGSLIRIELDPRLRYSEALALTHLIGNKDLAEHLNFLDYDHLNFVVGEHRLLFSARL
jgi:hypothetical protein